MVQAALFYGAFLDPFSPFDDGCRSTEVSVGRCDVAEALVIAPMVVVLDEGADLDLEVTRQIVVLEQDAVLQCLMPAFDFALRLGMMRGTPDMIHALRTEPLGQIGRDVG